MPDITTITGTESANTLRPSRNLTYVQALGGRDSIYVSSSYNSITVDAGEGNDSISNYSAHSSINGGAGNDTIYNSANASLTAIVGGSGKDSITNAASNVTIEGGDGDDSITTSGTYSVMITGGTGDDTIANTNNNADILYNYTPGDGNDLILGFNSLSTLLINGTYSTQVSGSDVIVMVGTSSITLSGAATLDEIYITSTTSAQTPTPTLPSGVTLISGTDNADTLRPSRNLTYVQALGGRDSIYVSSSYNSITVDAGEGNDSISNYSAHSSINGGAGNDTIYNSANASLTALDGGAGKDSITNAASNVTIEGGDGDDSITTSGTYSVMITGGTGDDTIANTNNNADVLYSYTPGDGNDLILGFNSLSTLKVNGTYSTQVSGSDIIVAVGTSSITLSGAATLDEIYITNTTPDEQPTPTLPSGVTLISGTDNADTLRPSRNLTYVQALGGRDSIYVSSSYNSITVDAGEGNDSISNYSARSSINGAAGNDTIYNSANASLTALDGGAGQDSITNAASNVTIEGGDGDDSITTSGTYSVMITGGSGDDTINNTNNNADILYSYTPGDGNDLITGFNSLSTLLINGTYSTQVSGSDVIVMVGTSSITLSGAATLDEIYITNTTSAQTPIPTLPSGVSLISGTDNADTIEVSASNQYVRALGGNDSINNYYDSVTIDAGAGDDTVDSRSNYSYINLGDGKDSIFNWGNNVTIEGGAGEDSIINYASNVTINAGAGNDSIENRWDENVTISGDEGSDTIENHGTNALLDGGAGNDSILHTGNNSTLLGGAGDDSFHIYDNDSSDYGYKFGVTVNGGTGSDFIYLDSHGLNALNALIQYTSGDGNDIIEGFDSTSTLSISGGTYTTQESGSDVLIKVGEGTITLKNVYLTADILNINGEKIELATKNVSLTNAVDDVSVQRNSLSVDLSGGDDTLSNIGNNVSIEGGAGNDEIRNDGGSDVTINGGDGNDVIGNYPVGLYDSKNDEYKEISPDNASISGGAGDDKISNYGSNVSINGGAGDDSITNYASNVLFQYASGDGNDTITGFNATSTLSIAAKEYTSATSGSDIIVTVGDGKINLRGVATLSTVNIDLDDSNIPTEGDDNMYNTLSGVVVNGLAGNDTILNTGDNVTIDGGAGNDTIQGDGKYTSINGGAGDDSIDNGGSLVTISAGTGNDKITNYVEGVSVIADGGEGEDTIINVGADSTIFGGTGNDSIRNVASNVTISGGSGNDTIYNNGEQAVSIDGEDGDDVIANVGENITIKAGAGADYIYNDSLASNVTIEAGAGDDTIESYGSNVLIKYASGDGSDYITGFNITSTLSISGGTYTSALSGSGGNIVIGSDTIDLGPSDIIIGVGKDSITLSGAAPLSKVNIIGSLAADSNLITYTEGNDSIKNSLSGVTINALAGDDYISNLGNNVSLSGGAGNDSIYNLLGESLTIDAGTGDDYIQSGWNSNVVIKYASGDGNDTIIGVSETSTLSIAGGSYSTQASGTDVLVKVGNGSVNIKNAQNYIDNLHINNETIPLSRKITLTDGDDTVETTRDSLTIAGGTGNDYISNYEGSNVLFKYTAGDGNDTIQGFNETSSLSIAGAEYSSAQNDSDLIIAVGNNSITLSGAATLSTVNILGTLKAIAPTEGDDYLENSLSGVTINALGGNDTIYNQWESDNVSINGGAGNDSIENGGANTTISGGEGDDSITSYGSSVTIDSGEGADYIQIDSCSEISIDAGAGDDSIYNYDGFDATINAGAGNDYIFNEGDATINAGAGNDTVVIYSSYNVLINYSAGDGNDIIEGFNENSSLSITGGEYSSAQNGSDLILTVGNGKITLSGAATLSTVNIIGTLDEGYSSVPTNGDDYLKNTQSSVVIDALAGNDTIQSAGDRVTINGGAGDDTIVNLDEGYNAVIDGGADNDYIRNFADSVSISGGEGDDTIVNINDGDGNEDGTFGDGRYVTINAGAGDDSIGNSGDNVSINGGEGDDYIYSSLGSNVTIEAGAGNDSIYNEGGQNVEIDAGEGNDYITNTNAGINSTVRGGAGADSIFNDVTGISMAGDDGDDYISNWKTGSNSTIRGGAGSDTIFSYADSVTIDGGTGDDYILTEDNKVLFQYAQGDGSDYIAGFNENSTLSISGSSYTSAQSGSSLIIVVGTDSITLSNAATLSSVNIIGTLDDGDSDSDSNTPTEGDDYIENTQSGMTINALGGNDTIYNSASASLTAIDGGAGNDSISNGSYDRYWYAGGNKVSISGGAGNDSILNAGDSVKVDGGAGDDLIQNHSSNSTIEGGEGSDTISNYGGSKNIMVSGGADNDYIWNYGENVTINGGAGSDTISNEGSNILINYSAGDGNDSIAGFNGTSTLSIAGGTYQSARSGNDLILTVGNGKITLSGAATLSSVNIIGTLEEEGDSDSDATVFTEGDDYFENTQSGVTINALGGDDTVYNNSSDVTINSGKGNDYVYNDSLGANVSIDGGEGNDSITNRGNNVSINGGADNDTINNDGANVLIVGGAGNDSIVNYETDVSIEGGAGDDEITNLGASVSIDGGEGNDLILNSKANSTLIGGVGNDSIVNSDGGESVIINGGDGADFIGNGGANATISGGAGNDTIFNEGSNVTINAGVGNDTIENEGANVLFQYAQGDGSDTITGFNSTSTLSISGGTYQSARSGNDLILTVGDGKITLEGAATLSSVNIIGTLEESDADADADTDADADADSDSNVIVLTEGNDALNNTLSGVVINALGGNDTIQNEIGFDRVTINAGAGDDTVGNWSASLKINMGDGDDYVYNAGTNTTIDGGEGADYIINEGDSNSINGGEGEDSIDSWGNSNTLSGGNGNDTIYNNYNVEGGYAYNNNEGNYILFQYVRGDGDDVIYGFKANSSLRIAGTKYTSAKSGNDIVFTVDDGKITLRGAATLSTINIIGDSTVPTEDDDYIENSLSGVKINALGGNDTIYNNSSGVTINSGKGNDYVYNDSLGANVTIDGGEGNDSITNRGNNVSINGGEDDDEIHNYGASVKIAASSGDDSITNGGKNVTISTGEGNDFINNVFGENVSINTGAGDDSISNGLSENVTIVAGDGADTINGFGGSNLIIDAGAGNDSIVNSTKESSISGGTGNDVISNDSVGSNVTISGDADDDYISNYGKNGALYGGEGNDTIVNQVDASSVLADGGAGDDYLVNGAINTTVEGGDGDDNILNAAAYVTMNGGAGIDTIYNNNTGNYVVINGGAGDDVLLNDGGTNVLFRYTAGDGNDSIVGFNATSTLSIAGAEYASAKSGNDVIIAVGDASITLDGAAAFVEINIDGENVEKPIWRLKGANATYGTSFYTLVTVKGVGSTDGLDISGTTVIVANAALNQSDVTISEGYELKLSDDVPSVKTAAANWSIEDTIATYTYAKTNEGYTLSDDKQSITYTPSSGGESFTVSGVGSTKGLTLDETTVTVSNTALNKSNVAISNGYELKLTDDVLSVETTKAAWSIEDTIATYTYAATSEGYELANDRKSITYTPASGGETFTVNGVKDTLGLSLNKTTVTVANTSLNKSNITISDGYDLNLANDAPSAKTTEANWNIKDDVATYTYASTSENYALSEDHKSITYTAATGGESFTVSGVASTDGLSLDNKVVTVSLASLNKSDITISNGYTLILGDDVIAAANANAPIWTFSGTSAFCWSVSDNDYKLSGDRRTISYTATDETELLLALSGIEKDNGLVVDNKKVTLSDGNFAEEEEVDVLSNAGGYEIELVAGNYAGVTFNGSDVKDRVMNLGENLIVNLGAGSDSIRNEGSRVTINGGKGIDRINNIGSQVSIIGGAGNDIVTLSASSLGGGNTFIYNKGDGRDEIYNFGTRDSIKISSDMNVEPEVSGTDVVFRIGTGSVTIIDGTKLGSEIKIIGSTGKEISTLAGNTYTTDGVLGRGEEGVPQILLSADLTEYKADDVIIVDGSQIRYGVSIDGGTKGETLIGGDGRDTLISGLAEDFSLTGGKGNDVFVFNGGKGIISDYSTKGSKGKDRLVISEDLVFEDYTVAARNLVLNYKGNNHLTLEGAAGTEITFGVKNSTVNTYKEDGIFDSSDKAVTLSSFKYSDDKFEATKSYAKLVTIDGSAADRVEIVGNKKANVIIAGGDGSTLNGGKGKDTLIGGEGADVFVLEAKSGNKIIRDYGSNDVIRFGAGAGFSEAQNKGGNLELKVGNNKITLEGGAGKEFKFDGGEGTEELILTSEGLLTSSDKISVSLTSAFADNKIDLTDENIKYRNVSAEILKKAVALTGFVDDNELTGGKGNDTLIGGDGDDTLRGGKGNDTLWGDAVDADSGGSDTFIFYAGDGTDVIKDYKHDESTFDELLIYDKRGRESTFSKAVFSGDKLTLNIKGGGKVIFENVTANDSFKINGFVHSISGRSLSKR